MVVVVVVVVVVLMVALSLHARFFEKGSMIHFPPALF